MPDFDSGFKIAARHSGRDLCRLGHTACDRLEPISDTVQTTERLADRAFRAWSGRERFVVYFEAYTRWRADARWNILAKSALLSERERLPTKTLVFVLTPRRYREPISPFHLQADGTTTQQVWFDHICLWRERPEPWWEQAPGLQTLLPLCNHGEKQEAAIVHATQIIKAQVSDTSGRADLLTALMFFGRLASPGLDVLNLIGRENMRESKAFDQVMALGLIEGRRADILEVLGVRFGPAAAQEFAAPLTGITDPDKLTELVRLAAKSRGLGPLRRALASSLP